MRGTGRRGTRKRVARGYGSNTNKGDYVIKLKGPYDIALARQTDGTFTMTTDWRDGHVEKEVGTNFGRLLQLYGVHKARIEAQRKGGYAVRRQTLGDGSIKLVLGGLSARQRTGILGGKQLIKRPGFRQSNSFFCKFLSAGHGRASMLR